VREAPDVWSRPFGFQRRLVDFRRADSEWHTGLAENLGASRRL
jgi:hypothetical protein